MGGFSENRDHFPDQNGCFWMDVYIYIILYLVCKWYMVIIWLYTVRKARCLPHKARLWQTLKSSFQRFPKDPPISADWNAAVRWAVGCGNSPRWIHHWWWKSGSFRASALPSTWGAWQAWQAWQGPARRQDFWKGPPRRCVSPSMPHQFPRYLQHVKPRSCHNWNVLEPLEGNCSKSSILELETLISAGIGSFWS